MIVSMEIQKTLPAGKVVVIADTREMRNDVTRSLRNFDLVLQEKQLEVGDYICSDRVGVERKRVSDFLDSIIDQRIFNQLGDLSQTFEKPVLIIEGNPELLFLERNMHSNTIRGVLSSIALDFRVPMIWTHNSVDTAAQIFWMARREQLDEKREIQIRSNKKNHSLAHYQEFLVAGLPFVSNTMSRRLLDHFKNPRNVFSATLEQLMEVDGIGKEKAKKIRDLLENEYKKD